MILGLASPLYATIYLFLYVSFCMYFGFGDCRQRKNDMLPVVPHFALRRRAALFYSLEHIFDQSHLSISS